MKNQYSLLIGADEFQLTQNFNSDNNSDNLDVSLMGKHIGEIQDETIPELDNDEIESFEERVTQWLNDNYFN